MDNLALFFIVFSLNKTNPIVDQVMIWGTNYVVYLTIILALILALRGGKKEKKAMLLMVVGLILTPLIIELIRLFIQEPRPFVTFNLQPLITPPGDLSFPSQHATNMAVVAFAFMFSRSKWALLFFLLMLWVGFTRVFVGVHYPLDVLGGFVTGFIISLGLAIPLNWIYRTTRRHIII